MAKHPVIDVSQLFRALAALFGFVYGALAGICIPLALMSEAAQALMNESFGMLVLVLAISLKPVLAVGGSVVGAGIAWIVTSPNVKAPPEQSTTQTDPGGHDPKDAESTPLAAGLLTFALTFGLFDWAIQTTLSVVLPAAVGDFLAIQPSNALPFSVVLGVHLMTLLPAIAIGRWTTYTLAARKVVRELPE